MSLRRLATVLALSGLLSGCIGPGGARSEPDRPSAGPASAGPASDSPAGQEARPSQRADAHGALARAKRVLRAAGSGLYTVNADLDGVRMLSDEGGFDLDGSAFELTRVLHAEEGMIASYIRVIDNVAYVQMLSWEAPMKGCWLRQPGAGQGSGALGPAAVAAFLLAEARGFIDDGAINVVIPTVLALRILGISESRMGDFDLGARENVPATVMLEDGRFRWMRVVGSEVGAALTKRSPSPEAEMLEALGLMAARVDLTVGEPVEVEVPARELIMTTTDGEMAGCPATTG